MVYNEFISRLRGVSVLCVMTMHYTFFFPIDLVGVHALKNGFYGVAMFFAISGFLITNNIIRRYGSVDSIDLGDFYVKRAGRILPPLILLVSLLSLLATLDIAGFSVPAGVSLRDAVWNVVTLRFNQFFLFGGSTMLPWSILWSLSIEEVFYLCYPLVAIALRREALLVVFLIVIAVNGPRSRDSVLDIYSYFGCFDLIAIGALASIAANRLNRTMSWASLRYLKIAGFTIAVCTYFAPPLITAGPTLMSVAAALMLFSSHFEREGQPPTALGWIGEFSYEIYLFHITVYILIGPTIREALGPASYATFAVVMISSFCIAAAIAKYFSEPLNRWIRSPHTGYRRWLPATGSSAG